MFRREPVRDAENIRAAVPAEHAARLVVRVEIADDEAAAVEVDGERSIGRLAVEPRGHAGDFEIAHCANGRRSRIEDRTFAAITRPSRLHRRLAQTVANAPLSQRAQELHLRIELLSVDDDRRLAREPDL